MRDKLREKEEKLDELTVDEELANKNLSIAEKKALEREAKQKYGKGWRKVLGVMRSIKVDKETMHDLYGMGLGGLREASKPGKLRRYR